jgi:hypothetical protein
MCRAAGFKLRTDEVPDLEFVNAVAFYRDESGFPRLVEAPPGPSTRQGVEARQAARAEKRNAARPKPSWMTR